jgi:hypothetical protein
MRNALFIATALTVFATTPSVADEPQPVVPVDVRVGPEIERAERDKYHLFEDVPGFVRAYVLAADEGYVLRLVYDRSGTRFVEERRLSRDEFDALRKAIESTVVGVGGNGEGRFRLVVHGTLYGAFLYGSQMVELLDVQEDRYQVGIFMLGTGAGFGAALYATRDYDRGNGFAKMLTTGSYSGLYYGMLPDLWYERKKEVRVDDFGYEYEVDGEPNRRRIIGAMVGVPAGMLAMGAINRNRPVTDGEADATFLGSVAGVGYGLAAAYLANAEKKSDLVQKRMYLSATGSLLPVGGFVGYRLAHTKALSPGHVTVLGLGGALGAYSGATFVRLMEGKEVGESKKSFVAAMSLAFPVGVATMYRLTSDQIYSRNRAGIATVGTIAGGLMGAGLVYVTTNADDSRPYLLASSLASIGAFAIVHKSTRTMTAAKPEPDTSSRELDGIAAAGTIAAIQQTTRGTRVPSPVDADSEKTWRLASPGELLTAAALATSGANVPAVRLLTARF